MDCYNLVDIQSLLDFLDWVDDGIYNNVLARVRSHSSGYYKLWAYHPSGQDEVRYLSTMDLYKEYRNAHLKNKKH